MDVPELVSGQLASAGETALICVCLFHNSSVRIHIDVETVPQEGVHEVIGTVKLCGGNKC